MVNWQEIKSEYESTSCRMKALAEKFNVSPSTLRSRKNREDWQRNATENVATQNDIVATDKKGGQLNNKNAKNNAGGSAPKKNKNRSVWSKNRLVLYLGVNNVPILLTDMIRLVGGGEKMAVRPWLSKEDFMNKYAKSESKYNSRITELREHPDFREAYISPSNKEVWIDEDIYQKFLIWKHENRFKR